MNAHIVATLLCALALAPTWAGAQQSPDRQRWQQMSPAERDRAVRERADRRDERDRQTERPSMSSDERQQLRRDISDHGRDIYGGQSGGQRSWQGQGQGQGRPQRP